MRKLYFSIEEKIDKLINKKCNQVIKQQEEKPIDIGDEIQICQRKGSNSKSIGIGIVSEIYCLTIRDCLAYGNIFKYESLENLANRSGFNTINELMNFLSRRHNLSNHLEKDLVIVRWRWKNETDENHMEDF